jgi:hypothetical protein
MTDLEDIGIVAETVLISSLPIEIGFLRFDIHRIEFPTSGSP